MRIIVRSGEFSPQNDLQPNGAELWFGSADELPAAVLATMSNEFEPGTWYNITDFIRIVETMTPVPEQDEVVSTVATSQHGVVGAWEAAIEVGQSRAALMVCKSVCKHASSSNGDGGKRWIRVE